MQINLIVHVSQAEDPKIQKLKQALEKLGFTVNFFAKHVFQTDLVKNFNFRLPTIIVLPVNFFNFNNCLRFYDALSYYQQKLIIIDPSISNEEKQRLRNIKQGSTLLLSTTLGLFLSFDNRHQQAWLRMRLQDMQ